MTYEKDLYGFVWDEEKNLINFKKHGVWFEEASEAFFDERSLVFFDGLHSKEGDERWVLIGLMPLDKKPVVCVHGCDEENLIVRLISARYSTQNEEDYYYEGRV